MIGHRSRFRENDDLPLRRGPVVKKKPPFPSNVGALITPKIMRTSRMRNAILGNDLKLRFLKVLIKSKENCEEVVDTLLTEWQVRFKENEKRQRILPWQQRKRAASCCWGQMAPPTAFHAAIFFSRFSFVSCTTDWAKEGLLVVYRKGGKLSTIKYIHRLFMESTPFTIFCDTICMNHFWSLDHLRSNLEIICGTGITCGPGSFASPYSTLANTRPGEFRSRQLPRMVPAAYLLESKFHVTAERYYDSKSLIDGCLLQSSFWFRRSPK